MKQRCSKTFKVARRLVSGSFKVVLCQIDAVETAQTFARPCNVDVLWSGPLGQFVELLPRGRLHEILPGVQSDAENLSLAAAVRHLGQV